jgi:hypothetical protein
MHVQVFSLSPFVTCVYAHTHMQIHKCARAIMRGILGVVFHALEDCFLAEIALV